MVNLENEFVNVNIHSLMIPSERVAHVQIGNSLEHALLVLTKSGYTAMPVLDPHYKLHGLISMPIIMDSILGLERIEYEKLESKKVQDVMNKNIPRIKLDSSITTIVDILVNHPFVCVEDKKGFFEGIITRRSVLFLLNEQTQDPL